MKISVTVAGGQHARDAIAALAQRARNMPQAWTRAGAAAMADFQARITEQGPGWAPPAGDYGSGSLLHRSGYLFRSLTLNAEGSIFDELSDGVRVGTNAKTPSGLSIAFLQQYGTGIYGRSGQPIRPTGGKALKFKMGSRTIVVRSVKGTPKRPFVYINTAGARKYTNIILQWIRGV